MPKCQIVKLSHKSPLKVVIPLVNPVAESAVKVAMAWTRGRRLEHDIVDRNVASEAPGQLRGVSWNPFQVNLERDRNTS